MVFGFIIKNIHTGKYEVIKDESLLAKEAEEKYLAEFPNYTIKDLKLEIEKIAEILIDSQESNRYTEILRQKAKNDKKMEKLRDAVLDDTQIMKYNRKQLKAKVKYKDYDCKYSIVLNMSTVARGRVFLNNYYIYKDVV